MNFSETIKKQRQAFGADLTIMGHHYQTDAVIRHTDLRGDSLELARHMSEVHSKNIIFCGVYFMAESAALLAAPGQEVYIPDPAAECSMAVMSPAPLVDYVLDELEAQGRKVLPLAYVNSTLAVKAVVGRHGGAVCTSANASRMLEWALDKADAVLFLPDENLGANTGTKLGLRDDDMVILGGHGRETQKARLLLWPGFCSIHTRFTLEHVKQARAAHPGATIVVHPECQPAVVKAVDLAGSTSFIIRYAEELPAGSTLIVGTEINLVQRLAEQHKGRISILPLFESYCPHMAQITEERLTLALDDLAVARRKNRDSGFVVRVADHLKTSAKATLERMFDVCS